MMIRLSAVLFALVLSSTAFCAAEDVDYGEMYVLQKRSAVQSRWNATLDYSYGFSNPYFATHGVNLSFTRDLSDYVFVGVAPSFYATADNDVPEKLTQDLGAQGITTKLYHPKSAEYAIVGVTPLTGMLNWFGSKPVNFNFSIGAGVGAAQYSELGNTLLSAKVFATPEVMLGAHFGIRAGIQAAFDQFSSASNEWQNRVDVFTGVSTRF